MQLHQDRCPNCSKYFCFPVADVAEQFLVVCPHCRVGYNLMNVEVDEELLDKLLFSKSVAFLRQKTGISKTIFQYLRSVITEFRFVSPSRPNAVVVHIARMRSPFPVGIYFRNAYSPTHSFNSLLLSALLVVPGAAILLAIGFALPAVLIGTIFAMLCFSKLVALPKIKGATLTRLIAEQKLLKQGYELQQSLKGVLNVKRTYQSLLQRQQSVLEQMLQTPNIYPTGIDLYQRAIKCTDDYLNLCDRAIAQYELAIRAILIQIETSKLAVEIPDRFIDPRLEFGLDRLEEQLTASIPPEFPPYDSNKDISYN